MHTEGVCQGVARGAQMLCMSHEDVVNDLKKSIEITKSTTSYCYPFYVYNNEAISALQEVGFKLAFAGGNTKATKSSYKYAIPRYQIKRDITIEDFEAIVN